MKKIQFFRKEDGSSPIEEFLDSLSKKQIQKVLWVLRIIEELDNIPTKFLRKIVNTEDIWEIRVQQGNDIFRLLGFIHENEFIVLTNGFVKKTQKTPAREITIALQRQQEFLKGNDYE